MAEESKSLLATGKAKMFFGVTLLVGILVGYFAAGYIPPQEDLAGTIGGVKKAEKYRAEQITDKDVILEDAEIQALLQSDKVQAMIKNDNFAEALRTYSEQARSTENLQNWVNSRASAFQGLAASFESLQPSEFRTLSALARNAEALTGFLDQARSAEERATVK